MKGSDFKATVKHWCCDQGCKVTNHRQQSYRVTNLSSLNLKFNCNLRGVLPGQLKYLDFLL